MPVDSDDKDMVNRLPKGIEFIEIADLEATGYLIATDMKAGECKLEFFNEGGSLSTFIGSSDEVYTMAQRLLKAYDKLEGL